VADLKSTTFSVEREYSLDKRMLKTPCIIYNVLLFNYVISVANIMMIWYIFICNWVATQWQ